MNRPTVKATGVDKQLLVNPSQTGRRGRGGLAYCVLAEPSQRSPVPWPSSRRRTAGARPRTCESEVRRTLGRTPDRSARSGAHAQDSAPGHPDGQATEPATSLAISIVDEKVCEVVDAANVPTPAAGP
jgi:hypothetical protein